jgi:transposase
VVARLREMMLASTRIFADETVVPVLDPGRGRTKQGYFWAIARDDRPWGGSQPPAVVYSYAPGRGHIHANRLLGGYRGILQCDGYAAYKKFAGSKSVEPSVTLAFCWSHVRRGFYDLAKAKAPIATETLQRIAALYAIEARVRGKSAADRLAVRQAESKPLVAELRVWFEAQIAKLPARGPTAEAIRYALNHWDGLEQFLDDGRIELDNNSVERAMRPVCLSRKNSLFAGSNVGASYCSSGYVPIKQRNLAGDCQIADVWIGVPRHRGVRRPVAGRQPELSMVPRHTAAALEVRRRSPFGRLSRGSPSGLQRLRRV